MDPADPVDQIDIHLLAVEDMGTTIDGVTDMETAVVRKVGEEAAAAVGVVVVAYTGGID